MNDGVEVPICSLKPGKRYVPVFSERDLQVAEPGLSASCSVRRVLHWEGTDVLSWEEFREGVIYRICCNLRHRVSRELRAGSFMNSEMLRPVGK